MMPPKTPCVGAFIVDPRRPESSFSHDIKIAIKHLQRNISLKLSGPLDRPACRSSRLHPLSFFRTSHHFVVRTTGAQALDLQHIRADLLHQVCVRQRLATAINAPRYSLAARLNPATRNGSRYGFRELAVSAGVAFEHFTSCVPCQPHRRLRALRYMSSRGRPVLHRRQF